MSVTPPSSWPWLDHPVSGLRLPTESPCSDSLSLRLPYSVKLAGKRKSLTHYTKGTPSPQLDWPSGPIKLAAQIAVAIRSASLFAFDPRSLRINSCVERICFFLEVLVLRAHYRARQQRTPEGQLSWGSDCLYACGFRIYFTPLPGFFSPFPHGTGSLSVDHEYLALEDGPPIFRQDVTCPALLVSRLVPHSPLQLRGCHPLRPAFPDRSPEVNAKSRRLLPFRSPLLWESRLISVPPAT